MRLALPLPDLARLPPMDARPPPDPLLLEAARAEGDAEGHARGFAEGLQEGIRRQAAAQEASIAASAASIAREMRNAAAEGDKAATAAAEALAGVLLAAMDAALPAESARQGEALIARIAGELRPALADRPEATVFVAPGFVDAIAARLPEGPPVAGDAALPPGDARIAWRDGACVIALETRRAAVREALASAGFDMGSDPT
jgi:flagellar assembly protein FliH